MEKKKPCNNAKIGTGVVIIKIIPYGMTVEGNPAGELKNKINIISYK